MFYKIEWTGNSLPSKKNSKQLRVNRKTGARFISSSDSYHAWEESFIKDIVSIGYTLGIVKSATIIFHPPDKRRWDLTNKADSIMDGLVKSGFLEDDNYLCIPELTLRFGGVNKGEWRVVIEFDTL